MNTEGHSVSLLWTVLPAVRLARAHAQGNKNTGNDKGKKYQKSSRERQQIINQKQRSAFSSSTSRTISFDLQKHPAYRGTVSLSGQQQAKESLGWRDIGFWLSMALDFAAVASTLAGARTFAACRSISSRDAIAAGDILHAAVVVRDELPLDGRDELVRLGVGEMMQARSWRHC